MAHPSVWDIICHKVYIMIIPIILNAETRATGRALAPKALDEGSYRGVGEGAPWATGAGL